MPHSNQIREFLLTPRGIDLLDVYVGQEGVLTGSMRLAQEARERAAEAERVREADVRRRTAERRRRALEAQIEALRAELEGEEDAERREAADDSARQALRRDSLAAMARSRKADAPKAASNGRGGAGPEHEIERGAQEEGAARRGADDDMWNLRLYVAGQSAKCVAAVRNLNAFCEEHLAGRYRIEVIDLLENPKLARDDQILAIPTLVRKVPEPLRKIVGDLSSAERMLVGFDCVRRTAEPDRENLIMDEHERTEAEDIVRAIRHGEVDAFVVRESDEDRIYSLRSADVLYRAMIEQMKDGAVALDSIGLIVYCNAYFAQLVKAERARADRDEDPPASCRRSGTATGSSSPSAIRRGTAPRARSSCARPTARRCR